MQVPFKEMLKSIPGAVGIRLEKELPFEVVRKQGELEIKKYPAFTLAQTSAMGSYDEASEVCFKRLAEYIFGNNSEQKTTEMTTPVFMDKHGGEWVMSFYLLDEYKNLRPVDQLIRVVEKPSKNVAVYQYSGIVTQESMEEARANLLSAVSKNGLRAVSDVWWAQYDQPVSVPMTKRNEALVMVETLA